MGDNKKISTYIQRERRVKENKGVDLVSVAVLVKSVGLDDSEKQDVKTDKCRLMSDERRAMATCDGGEGANYTK